MWYFLGKFLGLLFILMYFWCGGRRLVERVFFFVFFKVINFVGVEIVRDLGFGFFFEVRNNLFIFYENEIYFFLFFKSYFYLNEYI